MLRFRYDKDKESWRNCSRNKSRHTMNRNLPNLSASSPSGRWVRLGPYYAMFPVEYVTDVISRFGKPGWAVIDPFCGRGTVPFIAMTLGLPSLAADINPVAWIYAKTKTDPHPRLETLNLRITEIQESVEDDDRKPTSEFQQMAFCRNSLGFINAARKKLDWRRSRLDRTVAALLLQHLHGKLGQSLSNQLRQSRAMSPDYCVRWWSSKGLEHPPKIDPSKFLQKRANWRYAKGVPKLRGSMRPEVVLGDAASVLPKIEEVGRLVLTSPPYIGVTNYRADSWLRLWALGEGACRPDWSTDQKFSNLEKYKQTITACFSETQKRVAADAIWCVRTDARQRTRQVVKEVLNGLLPDHKLHESRAPYRAPTQTALYGDKKQKPGEIDLCYTP